MAHPLPGSRSGSMHSSPTTTRVAATTFPDRNCCPARRPSGARKMRYRIQPYLTRRSQQPCFEPSIAHRYHRRSGAGFQTWNRPRATYVPDSAGAVGPHTERHQKMTTTAEHLPDATTACPSWRTLKPGHEYDSISTTVGSPADTPARGSACSSQAAQTSSPTRRACSCIRSSSTASPSTSRPTNSANSQTMPSRGGSGSKLAGQTCSDDRHRRAGLPDDRAGRAPPCTASATLSSRRSSPGELCASRPADEGPWLIDPADLRGVRRPVRERFCGGDRMTTMTIDVGA